MKSLPLKPKKIFGKNKLAWAGITVFVFFSLPVVLAFPGGMANVLFPLSCLALGLFLYKFSPHLYLGMTWWIWALTPWIRRLVDYRSGWTDPSPILLAPLLMCMVSGIAFLKALPKIFDQDKVPFFVCFFCVFYAFIIGFLKNSPTSSALEFIQWVCPILMAFHLFFNWRDYLLNKKVMQKSFLWITFVLGGYGVFQFLALPGWDIYWMESAGLGSIGAPEPLSVRVFSTMNAPQPLAGFLVPGLILSFIGNSQQNYISSGLGFLSFLLSRARAAWLCWTVGLIVFLVSSRSKIQMKIVISAFIISLVIVPLINTDPFSEVILGRLQSLANTADDHSYNTRVEAYQIVFGEAISSFLGNGMGAKLNLPIGERDSGILALLLLLGSFAALIYVLGIGILFVRVFSGRAKNQDEFINASAAIALSGLCQIGFNLALTGVTGTVLWSFLGIGLAGHRFHSSRMLMKEKCPDLD